jgi:hypothetical protein
MNKKSLKILFDQCRQLWNEFDPIGVMEADIFDEYESYIPQTVKLVLEGADANKITTHIEHCVYVDIGMSKHSSMQAEIQNFVKKLCDLSNK